MTPTSRRNKLFAVLTVVLAPLLLLILLETVLSLTGYRSPFEDEDPYLGFNSNSPLFEKTTSGGVAVYATRSRKLRWFNHQEFLAEKPANCYRIFCLGGSTTFGRPYADATSFSGWLRLLLRSSDSSHVYEVINGGGVSYASYRVVNVMKEAAAYMPDLFVVYTGHNEFLEERTYGAIKEEPGALTGLRETLQGLRTYGLMKDLISTPRDVSKEEAEKKFQMTGEVNAILDHSVGIDRYHRDTIQTEHIVEHFRRNLNRMVEVARSCGADIVFVVPASNERDFSPFKSSFSRELSQDEHEAWNRAMEQANALLGQQQTGKALERLDFLEGTDPEFAEVRYRRGSALFRVGRMEEAKQEFVAARDEDIAPLRATSALQRTVRDVAALREVPLLDLQEFLESTLASEKGHTCLGNESFFDHCHPTIWVHQRIAEQLLRIVKERSSRLASVEWSRPDTARLYADAMAGLGSEYYGLRDLNLAKVLRWAGKKKEAEVFVRRASKELPTHPEAQYLLGLALQERGEVDSAERALQRAITLDTTNAGAYNALGSLFLRSGRTEEASRLFGKALAKNPELEGAHYNLGNALLRLKDPDGAIGAYQAELELNPGNIQALNNLGFVFLNRQQYDRAASFFDRAVALDPDNLEALSNLGIIAYVRGDLERAEQLFRAVLNIAPDDEYSREWLGRISSLARQGAGK